MEKYAKLIQPNTLKLERVLPGPIERVWEYIVDSEKRGKWFAAGELDPKEGGKMELIFNNSTLSAPPDPTPEKYKAYGDGYISHAIVVSFEPPNRLVIHWEDGIVTFALTTLDENQVKLTLTHEKLPQDRDGRIGVFAGWHGHLDILADKLSGNEPEGFWKTHMALEEDYASRI